MQVQIRNLQRRASGYFFRMGIPKDLRNHFDGKREIVKSLKTRDSNLAVIKAHEMAEVYSYELLVDADEPETSGYIGLIDARKLAGTTPTLTGKDATLTAGCQNTPKRLSTETPALSVNLATFSDHTSGTLVPQES